MVAKYVATSLAVASVALAGPLPAKRGFSFGGFGGFGSESGISGFSGSESEASSFSSSQSSSESVSGFEGFSGWGGFHSLDNFDNFYGKDNFCGFSDASSTVVTSTVTSTESEVVCQSVSVDIIQQQLAVIREYVKKIITTQICEVETQTVVFSQFQSGLYGFGEDIRHVSNRHAGFDSHIAGFIGNIHGSSGECLTSDLGFSGTDVGTSFVAPSGFNWVASTSPSSVSSAYGACQSAVSISGAPGSLGSSAPPTSDSSLAPPPTDSALPAAASDASVAPPAASAAASAAPAAASGGSSSAAPNPAND